MKAIQMMLQSPKRPATGRLEDLREAAEAEAKAYAIHYRVPGRTRSLLMLESEDDYMRYDIKPEAEAFIVKSSPAAKRFDEVMTALGSSLADPKAALLARRIEECEGMRRPRHREALAQLLRSPLAFLRDEVRREAKVQIVPLRSRLVLLIATVSPWFSPDLMG